MILTELVTDTNNDSDRIVTDTINVTDRSRN